ncbi:glutathione S-transferase [Xenococcus sp. PCC 7305]|uniref:glutathione S-transferase family protein n=1 Tax=Xenococcus sp. PCC 7305 TaxID=102125 RepID=UPI0002ABC03B|nr:glutathione S-transferase family protein [Xenococcus sp. PCC 7305]ELS02302.1 glutathione S-transferase [Xenococcus sp. PCC 7305]
MRIKAWELCLTVAISILMPTIAQTQEIDPQNIETTNSQLSLILYGGKRSRSQVVAWYLEELGIAYQDEKLDLRAGENKHPEYLAINPMGKVPALVDGDFNIWESGAILWYLANKYGEMPSDLIVQSETMQWILFANSTLANGLFIEDRQEQEMPRLLTPLNEILQDNPYIMGEEFTVADVAISFYLYAAKTRFNLEWQEYPFVVDYLERLTQREAFINTVGQR